MISSREMQQRLAALAAETVDLKLEAHSLAIGAVNGNHAAIARRAAIEAELARVSADSIALKDALAAVREHEQHESERAQAAVRAKHMADARSRAQRVVELAARADAMVADFRTLLGDLADTEHAVWDALRGAGNPPGGAVFGQKGIVATAAARMKVMIDGNDRFTNNQPADVSHVAATAWRGLIDGEHDNV